MALVRIAELEIDPAHLEIFEAELRNEIDTSISLESGVLAIYAVAEKGDRSKLHLLEIYADEGAYQAHFGSAHFLKYKEATRHMVRSLRLIDVHPIVLGAKPGPLAV